MKHILRNSLLLLSAAALTLAGCGKLNDEIEGLRSELGTLTERVAAIENTQIKALDEQIASIEEEVASLKAADKVLSEDVSTLEGKMSVVSSDLTKLKESVSALDASSNELSGKIDEINTKISQLETKITSILSSIEDLKAKVEVAGVTLSYIPKYSDNVERLQITRDGLKISGAASLWFTVSPESAAESIAKDWESSLSVLAFYTLTKADGGQAAELSVTGASVKDGILAVTVESDKLVKDFILGELGAALSLKVSCGDIKTVSSYINLTPEVEEEFITYLLQNFDSDGDGQPDNMDKAAKLNVSGRGLTSIDDILAQMPALTSLDCSNNNLTSIDLSKNEKLTTVDLSGNVNLSTLVLDGNDSLSKIIGPSRESILGWRLPQDISIFYLPDGSQLTIDDSLVAEIDGKTWKQFNFGASESNLYGTRKSFDEALTACPVGWRTPTKDELKSLSANYSDYTTYLGVEGRWFSGSNEYSSSVPAIFLQKKSEKVTDEGRYWSSTSSGETYAYYLFYASEEGRVMVDSYYGDKNMRSYEWSVRCVKEN